MNIPLRLLFDGYNHTGYKPARGGYIEVCSLCRNTKLCLYYRIRQKNNKPYHSYFTLPCKLCRHEDHMEQRPALRYSIYYHKPADEEIEEIVR